MTNEDMGPYIIWVDYGYEGWSPCSFATKEEALKHIKSGGFYGQIVATKVLKLSFDLED